MKPIIEVVVSPTGDLQVEAVGFKGADCEKATRFLEEALGLKGHRVTKPEYHQSITRHKLQQLGQ